MMNEKADPVVRETCGTNAGYGAHVKHKERTDCGRGCREAHAAHVQSDPTYRARQTAIKVARRAMRDAYREQYDQIVTRLQLSGEVAWGRVHDTAKRELVALPEMKPMYKILLDLAYKEELAKLEAE